MTHLRKLMLEELQRRNYAENTIRHYCSCLGARGGGWFRRLGRAHPRKGDFVGWMRALELVDRDDLAREILPAFANYWGAEHSDVFTSTVVLGGTSIRSENVSFGFVPLM